MNSETERQWENKVRKRRIDSQVAKGRVIGCDACLFRPIHCTDQPVALNVPMSKDEHQAHEQA